MIRVLVTTIALMSSTAYAGDVVKGEKAYKKCVACHTIEQDGKNKVGPNLWNIMNRGVATTDYRYSKGLKAWAEDNPMWTPELMDQWLTDSRKLVKGTKMNFRVRKEDQRADIIEYLKSKSE